MEEEVQQLVSLVHQLAKAVLIQSRKLEEQDKRIAALEYSKSTDAIGKQYGSLHELG